MLDALDVLLICAPCRCKCVFGTRFAVGVAMQAATLLAESKTSLAIPLLPMEVKSKVSSDIHSAQNVA